MIVVEVLPLPLRANSLIIAMAVGRMPPRPRPARNRNAPKTNGFGANAQASVSTEKAITVHTAVLRRPMMSVIVPTIAAPIITPMSPTLAIVAPVLGVRCQPGSFSRAGSTTPSTTRSYPSNATASQHSGATHPAYLERGLTTAFAVILILLDVTVPHRAALTYGSGSRAGARGSGPAERRRHWPGRLRNLRAQR